MLISPEQFAGEVERENSFLSLLPKDIYRMLQQQMYPHLENFERMDAAIAATKAAAEKNQEHENLLLNDLEYNKKLIEQLAANYHMSLTEEALMLNTPASLTILVLLKNKKDTQMYDVRNYGELLAENYWKERVSQVILDHLEYMISHPLTQDIKRRTNVAIEYVRRFINHPFIKKNRVFDRATVQNILPIVKAIDSIAHGFNAIQNRYNTASYGGSKVYNNTVSQDYWDIAIRLKDPISPDWAGPRNPYIMRKTLSQAFKNKDTSMINFYLDVFHALPSGENQINKAAFEQWDNEYQTFLQEDRFKISYQDFLNDIRNYLISSRDYTALNKLKSILHYKDWDNLAKTRALNITYERP